MRIKNNYGKEVFNGDFRGIITRDLAIAVNNAKTWQRYMFLDGRLMGKAAPPKRMNTKSEGKYQRS
jgi:hypothetical protein